MSESESYKSPELDDQSEYSICDGPYINERGDRHSDESSIYHLSEKADPKSINKKHVRRYNPALNATVRVEFFATNPTPNSFIKHAMSGTIQSSEGRTFRSGTKDEDLFFSTILATGEISGGAPVLFYDNPEQYERHFFTEVPQSIKDRWMEKRNAAIRSLDEKKTRTSTVVK
jgi:hypothetical protein